MADLGHDPGVMFGVWAAKTAGAFAGAGVSLIYLLPRSRREAARRFATGMICGLIFGGPTGLWLAERLGLSGMLSGAETMLAGSAAASLWGWGLCLAWLKDIGNRSGSSILRIRRRAPQPRLRVARRTLSPQAGREETGDADPYRPHVCLPRCHLR